MWHKEVYGMVKCKNESSRNCHFSSRNFVQAKSEHRQGVTVIWWMTANYTRKQLYSQKSEKIEQLEMFESGTANWKLFNFVQLVDLLFLQLSNVETFFPTKFSLLQKCTFYSSINQRSVHLTPVTLCRCTNFCLTKFILEKWCHFVLMDLISN